MTRPYACEGCGASGVKLWRDYGTPFHWDLWCVDCACAKSDPEKPIDPATVAEDGTRVSHVRFVLANEFGGPVMVEFDGPVPKERYLGTYNAMTVERREETSDQLGWYVPAIQSHDDPDVYWGYSSWTEERKGDWDAWAALPLRAKATVSA